MKHYLILALLLIVAVGFYFAGMVNGSIALFCVGALFELSAWLRLLKRHRKPASPA
jgi:hypothetical protein